MFAEMDDLLEWLDDIDAKYSGLEAISHEPEVIRLQLVEQKGLNEETQRQAEKLKEIAELSRSLVRGRFVEDSIELKEKLMKIPSHSTLIIDGTRAIFIDSDIYDVIVDFQENAKYREIQVELKHFHSKAQNYRKQGGIDGRLQKAVARQ